MKTCVKRIVATLLSLCLVFSLMPMNIDAVEVQKAVAYSGSTLDIAQGSVIIGDSTITYGASEYSYTGIAEVTVTGTTTENRIMVESGVSAKVILSDVSIDLSGADLGAAFEIEDNSPGNVAVTLAGNNLLKGSDGAAGLQKNGTGEDIGTLTIQGDGFLEAVGGFGSAGIGGAYGNNVANITIAGGAITASGTDAVGIGKGMGTNGNPVNIIVSGGSFKLGASATVAQIFDKDTYGDVIPKDAKGGYIWPMTINNESGEDVVIDGVSYPKTHGTSTELCVYLSVDGSHHVKVGADENDYIFEGALKQEFVCLAKAPESLKAYYGDTLSDLTLSEVTGGTWHWQEPETLVGAVGEHSFEAYFTQNEGEDYYSEPVDVTVNVLPKEIEIADVSVSVKDYDGTTSATVTKVIFEGLVGEDALVYKTDYTATAQFSDANAGADKKVTGRVELSNTDAAKNYTLKDAAFETTGTIGQIEYYDLVAENVTLTYGDTDGKVTVTSTSGGEITYSVTEGKDVISVDENTGKITVLKAGAATVKVTAAETVNYVEKSTSVTVTVNKKLIAVPQIISEKNEFTYTGLPQTYQITASDDYTISNDTKTEAGDGYEVVVTLNDSENTQWESELPIYVYSIKKAPVTITANDKTMIDDEEYPEYDYKVEGLVNNEELPITPSISCPNDKTVGEHAIIVTGPEESDNYMYTYVNGTLTITVRETPVITAQDMVLTYGDVDKTVGATTNSDGELSYEVVEGSDVISVNEDTGLITVHKAGDAEIKISTSKTDKCYAAEKTISVTVNKREIVPPAQNDADTFTYDGKAHTYALAESEYYTIAGNVQTNAGSYEASVTLNDPENTRWMSDIPIYAYVILPAQVTVTANDKLMGDGQDFPEYDYTVEGLIGGEELPIEPTISCDATRVQGTYEIKVTGPATSGNYTYTYVNGTLTVNVQVPQEITASDIVLVYGDKDAKVEAQTDGDGKITYDVTEGSDVISVDESTGKITSLKAGTATVKVTAEATANCTEDSTDITVTVNKKAVTITANDKVMVDDEEYPEYDYKVEGLVNNDELPITPVISCDAGNEAGTYVIKVTGPETSENYTYTYVDGKLTVTTRLQQEITASDIELNYGDKGVKIEAQTDGDGKISYAVTEGSDVISVDEETGAITILDIGDATVTITVTDTEDYIGATKDIKVTVGKAENAPNMPTDEINVACKTAKLSEIYLPVGWVWKDNSETVLIAGDIVSATAVYTENDADYYEKTSVEIKIARAAHTEGEEVLFDGENDVIPSCVSVGSGHTECTVCHATIRTGILGEKTEHNYKVTFEWSSDGKSCVVKQVCANDDSHVISSDCVVTSKVKTPATCKSMGVTTYTASFGDITDSKDVTDIPKTAHVWDGGVITKQPTSASVGEKTYTCKNCAETKKETVVALPMPVKGATVKSPDNKAVYTVTKAGAEVTFKAPVNKNSKTVVIPATITVDGVKYSVTAIAANAFANNKKVTSVTIGANVKTIGKKAFYNCKALKTLTVKTTKLTKKSIGSSAFKKLGSKNYKKVTVKVPKKKMSAYKKLFKQKGMSTKVKYKKG